jgi:regulator of replication initiation timing
MSTPTNFSNPTPTPNFGTPENRGGNKNLPTILGIVAALLLGTTVYFGIQNSSNKTALEVKGLEFEQQTAALQELDTKYNETVALLEQEKGKNAELDAKINQQLAELQSNKNSIAGLIREKKDYKSAIAGLEKQKQQYLVDIDNLKKQVGILTETNTTLTNENQNLNTSLVDTRSKLEQESAAKATLVSEKTQLETEKKVLDKKVDIASAVKVNNIQIKSVDVRNSGKEKERSKAKNVEKLNICFTTEANEVVAAGEETFYLRIIDPAGAPLAIESLGSGVSKDKKSESEFRYTTSATCNYANSATNLCGAWLPGQNFLKGKYNVEIYNKGYLVGASSFNLK